MIRDYVQVGEQVHHTSEVRVFTNPDVQRIVGAGWDHPSLNVWQHAACAWDRGYPDVDIHSINVWNGDERPSLWGRHGVRVRVTDPLHCTLAFYGKGRDEEFVHRLCEIVGAQLSAWPCIEARVGGVARFRGSEREGDPLVLLVGHHEIRRMREYLVYQAMPTSDFDYTPHVTLGRVHGVTTIAHVPCLTVAFRSVAVCAGEERASFPLR